MTAMDQAPPGPARRAVPGFVGFVLAVGLVWLGGQMVRQGVSDNDLADQPAAAVLWGGDSADALTAIARQRLLAHDPRRAAVFARRALQHEPLDEPALSLYGVAQDQLGQGALADRVMTLAGTRSWRDLTTQVWLFLRRMRERRFQEGLERADALIRRQPEPPAILLRILAAAMRDPDAMEAMARRLVYAPEWRRGFIDVLARDPQLPPDAAYPLLARLAAGPTPPTDGEIGSLLKRLTAQGDYAEAVQDWRVLTRAPPSTSLVNNGGFERAPGPAPFDWTLGAGVGWSAQIAPAPGEGHGQGLEVDYDGVSPPQPTQQLLVLAPGGYRLSGDQLSDGQGSSPPLVWEVACADSGESLARATFLPGEASQWRTFSADFVVPSAGCAAQWLRLTADPGEIHTDATVWYDNLRVAPAPAASPATPLTPPAANALAPPPSP